MSQTSDIRQLTPVTAPLALRDSGDIDRFNEAAERNLAELKALADDLNADFIPKTNAVSRNVSEVLPVLADVATVSAGIGAVAALAPHAANIDAVAATLDAVNAVGANIADVNLAADNMALIQAAPGHAETAAARAADAAGSALDAAADANGAAVSAAAALISETNAAGSEAEAGFSAAAASESAARAAESAAAAEASEGNASASATAAEAARDRCEELEDILTSGGTAWPVPNSPMRRDEHGRTQVADPESDGDVTTKSYVDAAITAAMPEVFFIGQIMPYHGLLDESGKHPLAGGTARTDWRVCDGEDGTPDLRDRFVVGAGAARPAGTQGGSGTHTHAISGSTNSVSVTASGTVASATISSTSTGSSSVSVSGTVAATTLTTSQMPNHNHIMTHGNTAVAQYTGPYSVVGGGSEHTTPVSFVGGGSSHTHTFSGSGGSHYHSVPATSHGHSFTGGSSSHAHTVTASASEADSVPPYAAVHFIMYVG